jgi:phosphohistidine phosphatase
MRHAEALSRAEAGVAYDAERPLTERGRLHARGLGKILRAMGIVADPVVSSPFVRAMQTATLVGHEFSSSLEPLAISILAPGAGPEELLRAGVNYPRRRHAWMLAVMHEPDISHILGSLICDGKTLPMAVLPGDCFGLQIMVARSETRAQLAFSCCPALLIPEPSPAADGQSR